MFYYAHSRVGQPEENWEPLLQHLQEVAQLAGQFARPFGAEAFGSLLGLWHDLGKYSQAFQDYLHISPVAESTIRGPDHSTAAAQHAIATVPAISGNRLLAYTLAGHHAGLPDWSDPTSIATLERRMVKPIEDWSAAPAEILVVPDLSRPSLQWNSDDKMRAFQFAVFGRMLFSCLVDADFLCTERFLNADQFRRRTTFDDFAKMDAQLTAHLENLVAEADPTPVNRMRRDILENCITAATLPPGLFSLTVPTGGGKTLSSLAFALRHILQHQNTHGLRRVIYAIPYTSIIEQNAKVYRKVFAPLGDDIVCEHHCNYDLYSTQTHATDETPWERLASENWDAPLVVTTNVQLFESLFASATSKCRKLHNIVGSVIILDEVQTLPVDLLKPCLTVLNELAVNYHCSIVLCSATQPAVQLRPDFGIGLTQVREIIGDPQQLHAQLRRTEIQHVGQRTDAQLAAALSDSKQVLCIVNTKDHARDLYQLLPNDGSAFHLSTNLCPAHRSRELTEIKKRLEATQPCRVVSTQLIEAGVDVDFPVVWRAMAGLDSIAQAAGRCNREGRHAKAMTYVFDAERGLPKKGDIAHTAHATTELLPDFDDLLDLNAIKRYFELHYWQQSDRWDQHKIMAMFTLDRSGPMFQYRTAAEKFRMIDSPTRPVIIPWGDRGQDLANRIAGLPADQPAPKSLFRQAQSFTVQVYEHIWKSLLEANAVTVYHDQFAILEQQACYHDKLGLCADMAGVIDPCNTVF